MSETALSAPVAQPGHVPNAVVYDFDMFHDPAYVADPHRRVLDLVENAPPVFWTPRNGGHWMLLSHAANFSASRDVESFSSEFVPQAKIKEMMALMPPGTPHIPQPLPINIDPPEHTKYRAPLQRAFSPKTILALRDSIRMLANELIDCIIDSRGCEFMAAIAEPLPVRVFLKMLGLPLERQEEYRALVKSQLSDPDPNPKNALMKLWRITAIMRDTLIERRERPQDDIISALWNTEIDGKATTMEDMENYCVLLFIAGLDTVMNGMGHGVRHLANDAALQADLRSNPQSVTLATEELLRRYTFTVPTRIVGKDIEFAGLQMKKGERAMLFLPAADLDPREYANAGSVDIKREKPHIAFNGGPHRCLGSHLARVELQVLYEQLLARLPPFRLDPHHPPTFHCGHVIGLDSLHIVWKE